MVSEGFQSAGQIDKSWHIVSTGVQSQGELSVNDILRRHAESLRQKADSVVAPYFTEVGGTVIPIWRFYAAHAPQLAAALSVNADYVIDFTQHLQEEGVIGVYNRPASGEMPAIPDSFTRKTVYAITAFCDLLPYRTFEDPGQWKVIIPETRKLTEMMIPGGSQVIFDPQGGPRVLTRR